MKIMFVFPQNFINGSGGTEKVCTLLANHFAKNEHQVIIATNENKTGSSFFELNSNISLVNIFNPEIKYINKKTIEKYKGKNVLKKINYKVNKLINSIYNAFLLKGRSKEEIRRHNLNIKSLQWKSFIEQSKPDLIITMAIQFLLEITYNQKYDIPIVNSVNGRPDYDYSDILWYRHPELMKDLINSYQHLSGIQILFDNYKQFLPQTFNGICHVIPNIVPQPLMAVEHNQNKDLYKIIMISRLDDGKNQQMAIEAFAKIANKYPNWIMEFYGTGTSEEKLQKQINALNLSKQVLLKGITTKPIEELLQSDIFIFPSKFEGFPLALTEAMSVGLPSIGLASCSGVNQLIIHNQNGFLVNDVDEMSNALENLINYPDLRQKLGQNAKEFVKQFNKKDVLEKWDNLIKEVANGKI